MSPRTAAIWGAAFLIGAATCPPARSATAPALVARQLASGAPAVVIVEYDSRDAERDLAALRARLPRRGLADAALLDATRDRYRALKTAADALAGVPDADVLQDHSHLPMRNLRLRSPAALAALAAHPSVAAIHADGVLQRVLVQSLPLVGQPTAAAAGYGGAGATVAVIDDGLDLANPAFGCTAVGQPAGCRVVASQTIVSSPGTSVEHGTNVAATVAGVAGQASVAMLNVFGASGATFADVVTAINWAIANRSLYDIVAINLSLGDTTHSTQACSANNPFVAPVSNARAAGIAVVAAAGNLATVNGGFVAGLAKPACTPGVLSVGAVYDANLGGLSWSAAPYQCTDAATQADRIACFSQSASILSLLAPGAIVAAGGIAMGGTSQAAPHAAGALAVLRGAFPDDTLAQIEARLKTSPVRLVDARNGVAVPRLSLPDALRPDNDAFSGRRPLGGAPGSTTGTNRLATREAGEPQHAAPGSTSVWWTWTAPATGQVTLSSAGSSFDTTLAVYTGGTPAGLVRQADNDNAPGSTTSSLLFQAQAGTAYQWAVDGAAGAAGSIALQWSLNAAASADLSASVTGPVTVATGVAQAFVLTLRNDGPQTATHASLALALPVGVAVAGVPEGCTVADALVRCTVPTLAVGEVASWTVPLIWSAAATSSTLTATAASDLPDAKSANDRTSLDVAPAAQGDVPMPAWALALLAASLLAGSRRRTERARHPGRVFSPPP